MITRLVLGVTALLACAQQVSAAKESLNASTVAKMRELTSRIKYETGEIKLGSGLATIKLTDSYRYVNPAGAETVLTGIWGNPPSDSKTLGLIVPIGFDPFDTQSWCVVVTHTDDGYIKDSDAETIDYNDLLKEMQETIREENKERVKQGYAATELVGWAEPPKYDKTTHKFVWAKELKFADSDEGNTLNYSLRVLGRGGVLNLNAVANMSDLSKVQKAAPQILSMVDFDPGQRYADYKPGTDKVATYGLAGLVAGGIAAKTGLLKGLFVGLLAMKKFIVLAVVGIVALIGKIFRGKSNS